MHARRFLLISVPAYAHPLPPTHTTRAHSTRLLIPLFPSLSLYTSYSGAPAFSPFSIHVSHTHNQCYFCDMHNIPLPPLCKESLG
ncbi:uncharacterized protein EI90DRAFT_3030911, partial [Cantharellus anzutake]|uniref:uncharacterized protein n=1 Tax=Cantharellus anzutake TaxID=1750568 RepID=UPI001907D9F3